MNFSLENPSRRKTSKILTIGNYSVMIIDIIQSLIFVPLYLFYIGERLYGLWLGTGGVLAVLAFLDMGIATLTIQRVSREFGKKNYDGVSKYFSGGVLINSAFMLVLFLGGMVLSFWIGTIFPETTAQENELLTTAFQIALVALVFSLLNNTIGGTINALQKPLISKIFQLLGAIVGILVVYFMLFSDQPLLAIPLGLLARNTLSLFPNLVFLLILFGKNNIPFLCYNKEVIKDYLHLTPNLMLSKFGTSLVGNIEPTFINMFISAEVAVYFSVTKKAGGLIKTILDRIGGVLYPSMSHLYSEESILKYNDVFMKLMNYIVPFTIMLFLVYILLNKPFVDIWVGEKNYLGDVMTLLISGSLFISFISNFLSYLLSSTGDIKFSSNNVFYESLTKVILLYLLLMMLGVEGLPVAIGIASLIFAIVYLKRWNSHLLINKQNLVKLFKEHAIITATLITVSILLHIGMRWWAPAYTVISFTLIGFFILSILTVSMIISSSTYRSFVISKIRSSQ